MRKAPFRTNNEISQQYNDGSVKIYTVTDGAKPGYQPVEKTELKYKLHFENRALGIKRIYLSRQQQAQIVKVIRVPRVDISPQDIAITHDGKQYRIDTVQDVMGVYPPSLDLSLKTIERKLEVMPE